MRRARNGFMRGGGYLVAQLLVAEATGLPFIALMQDLVLGPVGMTQHVPAAACWEKIALAHNSKGETVPGGWHLYPESAADGLWTTPSDLAAFAIAVMKAERGEPGAIIGQTLAHEMVEAESVRAVLALSWVEKDVRAGSVTTGPMKGSTGC